MGFYRDSVTDKSWQLAQKLARQYQLVNLKGLSNFSEGSLIDSNVLAENRLIKNSKGLIKILAEGRLTHALTVRAHKFSKGAIEKIQKAGGKIEIIE